MAMSSGRDAMIPLLLLAMSLTATPGSASATEAPRLLAQAASPAWTAKVDTSPRGVSIEARASGGTARLTGGCATALLSPGLWMTLFNPPGLPRVNGRRMTMNFAVTGGFGTQTFKARMRYEAPGDSWPSEGPLPPDFVSAFEAGGLLTISDPAGRKLADLNLRGAEEAVQLMRRVCGL
ncbi:MAG TPA: hypothetical protein VGN82_07890 [Bosea sp. (in: a-proteobacteria)]|uniref:hypothetical protein n=1 Tax=Bosea sp. (in: a-proteobacteria) TaxID=1871050 RepID=UPI002E10C4DF|nr:hypothetical protein [Bosea sp. (in: a-proteobacteria)]